jgi:hypothetical protein
MERDEIMKNSSLVRGLLILVAVVVGLAVLRNRPWERTEVATGGKSGDTRARLAVGFLPVT